MSSRALQTVLIPLPSRDFDPSEVAVSWAILREAGHPVCFATPDGKMAQGDPLMLSGEGLDLWGWVPGLKKLKLLGLMLRANGDARRAYAALQQDAAFQQPMAWADVQADAVEALLLPGGHWARGMKVYLESALLQALVVSCFARDKPVAAICHGVVLAARSISTVTGQSVLYGRKTTALTWKLEKSAWHLMKFLGRVWEPNYYRTYMERAGEPSGFASVEAEVKRALARESDFLDVATDAPQAFRKGSGLFRDNLHDASPAFVVRDGRYVSARWPGDVHTFARTFVTVLREADSKASTAS